MGKVFVITGPSGVGKGTLISRLRERVPDLALSVSATTRGPRPGEEDGREYHFLDAAEFERRISSGDFLEHAEYSGNRYGTLRSEVDKQLAAGRSVALEIEVQGARQVRETMPEAVLIFIAPPTPEVLRERLEGRGTDSGEAIQRRLEVAREELAARDEFAHQVVNDEIEHATAVLEGIVREESDA
jgi:guanylate kinase